MAGPKMNSLFDMELDATREAQPDSAAEAEIEAGTGMPHARVRAWLERRVRGERVPPPAE